MDTRCPISETRGPETWNALGTGDFPSDNSFSDWFEWFSWRVRQVLLWRWQSDDHYLWIGRCNLHSCPAKSKLHWIDRIGCPQNRRRGIPDARNISDHNKSALLHNWYNVTWRPIYTVRSTLTHMRAIAVSNLRGQIQTTIVIVNIFHTHSMAVSIFRCSKFDHASLCWRGLRTFFLWCT